MIVGPVYDVRMTEPGDAVLRAIEQAAVSGLCRDGQLEIGVQEARERRPELDDDALLAWVEALLAEEAGQG